MVFVDTAKYAATSLTLSSVRNLSAESSVNDAKTCDCLESEPPSSRVVASGCEALLLPGQASTGLRSRGPQVRLLPGAPIHASVFWRFSGASIFPSLRSRRRAAPAQQNRLSQPGRAAPEAGAAGS